MHLLLANSKQTAPPNRAETAPAFLRQGTYFPPYLHINTPRNKNYQAFPFSDPHFVSQPLLSSKLADSFSKIICEQKTVIQLSSLSKHVPNRPAIWFNGDSTTVLTHASSISPSFRAGTPYPTTVSLWRRTKIDTTLHPAHQKNLRTSSSHRLMHSVQVPSALRTHAPPVFPSDSPHKLSTTCENHVLRGIVSE